MVLAELRQLLAGRFAGIAATQDAAHNGYITLKCKKCGWTCMFVEHAIIDWSVGKDGLSSWLLRHVHLGE